MSIDATVESLFRLTGETAVITGAAAGIGRAIAVLFARAGADVVVVDRDQAAVQQTVQQIVGAGGRAVSAVADVADMEQVQRAMSTAIQSFGRLDVLVNNAGIYPLAAPLPELDWPTYQRTLAVNVQGVLQCSCAAAKLMKPGGRIINISSIESLRPSNPGMANYCASKGAVNAITRSSAVDLAPLGIRANAILPGIVATEGTSGMGPDMFAAIGQKTPSRRCGEPGDIAAAALFLASNASSLVNGHCLVVDGGVTISG